MNPEIRHKLAALGVELSMDLFAVTNALFAELQPPLPEGLRVTRDHAYGPDERQRLDVFAMRGLEKAPVLVFVPGGGFVRGDKRSPTPPFYDNIGGFAARNGMIGVTMNYRLAPAHRWPAGTDDMALAVDWLRANIAQFGGDPERIYLAGTSAGAVHVGSYVALRDARIAGAVMISGGYDMSSIDHNDGHLAYYGDDPEIDRKASTTQGLIASDVPCLFTICEFDPAQFQKQAASLCEAWARAKGVFPRMLWLRGHNHQSSTVSIGSSEDSLGPEILRFIADTAR
ncbi:MAG: alpha/beta hydrolase [Sphingobium sp.]|nr:alpha/beta hydrolase [Sphingobium sp.]